MINVSGRDTKSASSNHVIPLRVKGSRRNHVRTKFAVPSYSCPLLAVQRNVGLCQNATVPQQVLPSHLVGWDGPAVLPAVLHRRAGGSHKQRARPCLVCRRSEAIDDLEGRDCEGRRPRQLRCPRTIGAELPGYPSGIEEATLGTVHAESNTLLSSALCLPLLAHSPGISNRHLVPSGAKESSAAPPSSKGINSRIMLVP